MAFVLNDRVKETTTTTGTGTISLAGAETGFETFVAGIGTTNKTFYAIELPGNAEFEVGIGTVTDASPDTLSRDTMSSPHQIQIVQWIFLQEQKMFFVLILHQEHPLQVWQPQLMLLIIQQLCLMIKQLVMQY